MTINDKEMQNAFAVIDFTKYVEDEYVSVCLDMLADSVKNPIKREQLKEAVKLVYRLEGAE